MVKKSSYFDICAKHRPKMEGVVLNRVGISQIFFCPKQGQGFRLSAQPQHLNFHQVRPPPWEP